MKVFKFGGASIKDANGFRNVSRILETFVKGGETDIVVVISALGKTTNALEDVVRAYYAGTGAGEKLNEITTHHFNIAKELFAEQSHAVFGVLNNLFVELEWILEEERKESYDYSYDQIVSVGELASSSIMSALLNSSGVNTQWVDAREFIRTDDHYREAVVQWEITGQLVKKHLAVSGPIKVTQGFIGSTDDNITTTLGREGSDYSAAILAYCLDADEVVIWKDVPGVLNADPRYFHDVKLIKTLSYHEAIEMTYYGATVIHPKTLKPLQNKQIPLAVKSFLAPQSNGTLIHSDLQVDSLPSTWVKKVRQTLISISAKDFSFIAEDHLHEIFNILSCSRVHVNMMQNSALSFSICVDDSSGNLMECIELLKNRFRVKINTGLELLTVRHYSDEEIEQYLATKNVLLEQRSRTTVQVVHD